MTSREWIRRTGLLLLGGFTAIFYILHFQATIAENQFVLYLPNWFGEAIVEAVILFTVLPIMLYGIYKSWNK